MKYFIPIIFFSVILAHDSESENIGWRQYSRLGIVRASSNSVGLASYARLKRTTSYTFHDFRFYGHFFDQNQEIKIRQKTSRRFMSIERLYTFNTLIYEKNTFIDVNLRYHFNQGFGWLFQNSDTGNMTLEMGFAFDNSDYLNSVQKTSYAKTGFTSDRDFTRFKTKIEINYFHQVSKLVNNIDFSRMQLVGEIQLAIQNKIAVIFGLTQDLSTGESYTDETASVFFTLAYNQPLEWDL
ncbi:MAG: DUF481 domain-containing protein [Candidatus Marinimicrobia bacterium]|jgi:hypothetical protein|nr:DUF481 domain-containing protein [Candidatus Neomarinimicrobiota bacterium]MBT3838433.1 DUF481 domain-containing protein [Candidatus Neomarinimicrobiota bacterium]MBT3998738.1 DUF481 domain-containing protein [Candidatus Neomarinimicrobiota bacterium]MBT4283317.1 DUF481 domain-containing protein [Candidatus Neomarinimicrobiota bacterium]MBT4578370.1 DUF481 domain-containing protein [Candidatus Neomarinimicrobiota bacterium]